MKIGDMVRVLDKSAGTLFSQSDLIERFGSELVGEVVGYGEQNGYTTTIVEAQNGHKYSFYANDLELVNNNKTMKLNDNQKLALTPEAQALVEAGLIDMCTGGLTCKGTATLEAILMAEYHSDLVSKAKEMIKESEAKETLANAKKVIASI